ncbi:hypothetical protein [Streptomyces sp. NBC_00467]|uniref:hypothetical protein n=1 Tax=Streptomyces sp. NBC_00467 TaxID=2975752 RepID=UPI002E181E02
MQFSSNDQPPTTPLKISEFTGAGIAKDELTLAPSDTQQRARHDQSNPVFHAEAVLTVII